MPYQCLTNSSSSDARTSFSLLKRVRLLCGFATSITIYPNEHLHNQENMLNYYCNQKIEHVNTRKIKEIKEGYKREQRKN